MTSRYREDSACELVIIHDEFLMVSGFTVDDVDISYTLYMHY